MDKSSTKILAKRLLKNNGKNVDQSLSDITAEEQQLDATKHLWELFHRNLRALLTTGGWSAGFQLLQNAIDLTDIRAQIAGWDSMPLAIINKQNAPDFDSPNILAEEIIQVSKVGPMRTTDGTKWIDEYKGYLSGVQGINQVTIPNPDTTLSARRTKEYEWTLNNCTVKYNEASPLVVAKFDMEQFSNTFCPEVKHKESAMFAQIGKEQAAIGNNPSYAAAVALGMAQGLFTMSTAFKKYHSFRSMEYECLKSQEEMRPLNGNARSFEFNYNFHNWKNTQESTSFSVSAGYGLFNVKVGHEKETVKGLDLTAIGGVEIAFEDFKYVPLYPGEWYSSTALKDFRYHAREASASPISRYFGGTGGSLTLMPKALYVANNPAISFFVKSDKKETFMQKTSTSIGGGLSIFGFNFGGSYAKGKQVDEGTETGGLSKITIKSNSCRPQLFALENHYTY